MSESRATEATQRSIANSAETLPMADDQDFEDATRGFVDGVIRDKSRPRTGAVWDLDAYAFLAHAVPDNRHRTRSSSILRSTIGNTG